MTLWWAVVVGSVGCYLLKLVGLSVPSRVLDHPVVERVADLIPVALLAALVGVQVFASSGSLVVDARLAGLAFALSPRLFGLAGVLSAEVLPTAVLPWVCLPLLLTHRGRISACRGGLLSGLAVLGMGGVNAVENLAALPLPLLIVMGGLGSVTGRRLARWWVLTTAAVSLWWDRR